MKPVRFNKVSGLGRCCKRHDLARALLTVFSVVLLLTAFQSVARAETRTLKMYFTHTKESTTFTFKKNGKYLQKGLKKANRFLRDWRRKEPTKMDPALLDLVWEVYQRSGSRKPIHVISGYRSPRTNTMLRRRGRNVAKNSQHTRGKALDFFLTDVSVAKLRALGLQAHRGGVGYYRGSFVHLDTGRVRHWPRMSAKQLAKVFPRGKTIHIPSNGKSLKGYKSAKLNLQKGLNADGSKRTTRVRKRLLAKLFTGKGGNKSDEREIPSATKPSNRPQIQTPVPTASLRPKDKKPKKEKPNQKKPQGADPFSLENVAEKRKDDARKRREKELAAAKLAREKEAAKAAQLARAAEETRQKELKRAKQVAEAARKAQEVAVAKRAQEVAEAARLAQQTAAAKRAREIAEAAKLVQQAEADRRAKEISVAAQLAQESLAAQRARETALAKKKAEEVAALIRAQDIAAAKKAERIAIAKRALEAAQAAELALKLAEEKRAVQLVAAERLAEQVAASNRAQQVAAAALQERERAAERLAQQVAAAKLADEVVARVSYDNFGATPSTGRLTIPRRRPGSAQLLAQAATKQLNELQSINSERAALELASLQPSAQTELALAAPSSITDPLRLASAEPTASTESQNGTVDLSGRIEAALAGERQLTPVERAAQQQSNSKLAEALKSIPVPRSRAARPEAIQLALARSVQPTINQSALRAALDRARLAPSDDNVLATPSWRNAAFTSRLGDGDNAFRVPLPSSQPKSAAEQPVLTGFARQSDADAGSQLSLGDLDGASVKTWAVSVSTRIGSAAALTAPNYEQSTRRAAPHSVYSVGFAPTRFPLRSDRFSGRALTRVAFAQFGQTQ